jgi:predicted transcriptional regulator
MNYAVTAQVLQNAIDNDQVVLLKSSLNGGTDVYGFTPKGRSLLKQLKNRFGI